MLIYKTYREKSVQLSIGKNCTVIHCSKFISYEL